MNQIVIEDRTESARGCGYRKKGGIYLVSSGISSPCGKLPIKLDVCPTCGHGIKPSRGWTWVDADALGDGRECHADVSTCNLCPLSGLMGRAGLLWIGEKHYPTPGDFSSEAIRQGISRRLSQVPRDFVIGETWVLVAHRKASDTHCPNWEKHTLIPGDLAACEICKGTGRTPCAGIFHAFKPTAIEYVVTDSETTEELQKLVDRGFTLVRVHRDDGQDTEAAHENTTDTE